MEFLNTERTKPLEGRHLLRRQSLGDHLQNMVHLLPESHMLLNWVFGEDLSVAVHVFRRRRHCAHAFHYLVESGRVNRLKFFYCLDGFGQFDFELDVCFLLLACGKFLSCFVFGVRAFRLSTGAVVAPLLVDLFLLF